jgi:hypothetical protein
MGGGFGGGGGEGREAEQGESRKDRYEQTRLKEFSAPRKSAPFKGRLAVSCAEPESNFTKIRILRKGGMISAPESYPQLVFAYQINGVLFHSIGGVRCSALSLLYIPLMTIDPFALQSSPTTAKPVS